MKSIMRTNYQVILILVVITLTLAESNTSSPKTKGADHKPSTGTPSNEKTDVKRTINNITSIRSKRNSCLVTKTYGGTGGDQFYDNFSVVGIKKIEIWYEATRIYGIQTTYINTSGTSFLSSLHGSSNKEFTKAAIPFSYGEKIIAIIGHHDSLVRNIVFLTETLSGARRVYGPYGGKANTMFVVNRNVVAFFGRSGSSIDALGFCYSD